MFNKKKDLNKNIKINKKKKGFTLIELVVVIAVIAILAGVSVAAYFGVTDSANKSALKTIVKQVKDGFEIYRTLDKDSLEIDNTKIGNNKNNETYFKNRVTQTLNEQNIDASEIEENMNVITKDEAYEICDAFILFINNYIGYDNGCLNYYLPSAENYENVIFLVADPNSGYSTTLNGTLNEKEIVNIDFGLEDNEMHSSIQETTDAALIGSLGDDEEVSENISLSTGLWEYYIEDNYSYYSERVKLALYQDNGNGESTLFKELDWRLNKPVDKEAISKLFPTKEKYISKDEKEYSYKEDGFNVCSAISSIADKNGSKIEFPFVLNDSNVDKEDETLVFNFYLKTNDLIDDFNTVATITRDYGNIIYNEYYDESGKFLDREISKRDNNYEMYYFDDLAVALDYASSYEVEAVFKKYERVEASCGGGYDDTYIEGSDRIDVSKEYDVVSVRQAEAELNTDCTIKEGVTLLVSGSKEAIIQSKEIEQGYLKTSSNGKAMDSCDYSLLDLAKNDTVFKTASRKEFSYDSPLAISKINIKNNSVLTNNGNIIVSGMVGLSSTSPASDKSYLAGTGMQGEIIAYFGAINIDEGSKIINNNKGNMVVSGLITGEGSLENLGQLDLRVSYRYGGSASTVNDDYNANYSPVYQFHFDSIKSDLLCKFGSNVKGLITLFGDSVGFQEAYLNFIGSSESEDYFCNLEEDSYILKTYSQYSDKDGGDDGFSTETLIINGNTNVNAFTFEINVYSFITVTVDFSTILFPTGNLNFNFQSGVCNINGINFHIQGRYFNSASSSVSFNDKKTPSKFIVSEDATLNFNNSSIVVDGDAIFENYGTINFNTSNDKLFDQYNANKTGLAGYIDNKGGEINFTKEYDKGATVIYKLTSLSFNSAKNDVESSKDYYSCEVPYVVNKDDVFDPKYTYLFIDNRSGNSGKQYLILSDTQIKYKDVFERLSLNDSDHISRVSNYSSVSEEQKSKYIFDNTSTKNLDNPYYVYYIY